MPNAKMPAMPASVRVRMLDKTHYARVCLQNMCELVVISLERHTCTCTGHEALLCCLHILFVVQVPNEIIMENV